MQNQAGYEAPALAERTKSSSVSWRRLYAEETPGVEIINALSDVVEEVLWREQILGIVMV